MENSLNLNQSEFLLYISQNGEVKVDVLLQDETVWLTQKSMQELFGTAKQTVSEHIISVFKEGELEENQVVRKFRTTASDSKNYNTSFYNLYVIISVGYRVKSQWRM
ncbi:MAG: cell filamentation protein Fic [Bacteroidota bacterium]